MPAPDALLVNAQAIYTNGNSDFSLEPHAPLVLSIENLHKSYIVDEPVLRGVTLAIRAGGHHKIFSGRICVTLRGAICNSYQYPRALTRTARLCTTKKMHSSR